MEPFLLYGRALRLREEYRLVTEFLESFRAKYPDRRHPSEGGDPDVYRMEKAIAAHDTQVDLSSSAVRLAMPGMLRRPELRPLVSEDVRMDVRPLDKQYYQRAMGTREDAGRGTYRFNERGTVAAPRARPVRKSEAERNRDRRERARVNRAGKTLGGRPVMSREDTARREVAIQKRAQLDVTAARMSTRVGRRNAGVGKEGRRRDVVRPPLTRLPKITGPYAPPTAEVEVDDIDKHGIDTLLKAGLIDPAADVGPAFFQHPGDFQPVLSVESIATMHKGVGRRRGMSAQSVHNDPEGGAGAGGTTLPPGLRQHVSAGPPTGREDVEEGRHSRVEGEGEGAEAVRLQDTIASLPTHEERQRETYVPRTQAPAIVHGGRDQSSAAGYYPASLPPALQHLKLDPQYVGTYDAHPSTRTVRGPLGSSMLERRLRPLQQVKPHMISTWVHPAVSHSLADTGSRAPSGMEGEDMGEDVPGEGSGQGEGDERETETSDAADDETGGDDAASSAGTVPLLEIPIPVRSASFLEMLYGVREVDINLSAAKDPSIPLCDEQEVLTQAMQAVSKHMPHTATAVLPALSLLVHSLSLKGALIGTLNLDHLAVCASTLIQTRDITPYVYEDGDEPGKGAAPAVWVRKGPVRYTTWGAAVLLQSRYRQLLALRKAQLRRRENASADLVRRLVRAAGKRRIAQRQRESALLIRNAGVNVLQSQMRHTFSDVGLCPPFNCGTLDQGSYHTLVIVLLDSASEQARAATLLQSLCWLFDLHSQLLVVTRDPIPPGLIARVLEPFGDVKDRVSVLDMGQSVISSLAKVCRGGRVPLPVALMADRVCVQAIKDVLAKHPQHTPFLLPPQGECYPDTSCQRLVHTLGVPVLGYSGLADTVRRHMLLSGSSRVMQNTDFTSQLCIVGPDLGHLVGEACTVLQAESYPDFLGVFREGELIRAGSQLDKERAEAEREAAEAAFAASGSDSDISEREESDDYMSGFGLGKSDSVPAAVSTGPRPSLVSPNTYHLSNLGKDAVLRACRVFREQTEDVFVTPPTMSGPLFSCVDVPLYGVGPKGEARPRHPSPFVMREGGSYGEADGVSLMPLVPRSEETFSAVYGTGEEEDPPHDLLRLTSLPPGRSVQASGSVSIFVSPCAGDARPGTSLTVPPYVTVFATHDEVSAWNRSPHVGMPYVSVGTVSPMLLIPPYAATVAARGVGAALAKEGRSGVFTVHLVSTRPSSSTEGAEGEEEEEEEVGDDAPAGVWLYVSGITPGITPRVSHFLSMSGLSHTEYDNTSGLLISRSTAVDKESLPIPPDFTGCNTPWSDALPFRIGDGIPARTFLSIPMLRHESLPLLTVTKVLRGFGKRSLYNEDNTQGAVFDVELVTGHTEDSVPSCGLVFVGPNVASVAKKVTDTLSGVMFVLDKARRGAALKATPTYQETGMECDADEVEEIAAVNDVGMADIVQGALLPLYQK
ncbi:hypothetical protein KIPB_000169 [Kipferlia bialata]|uniref:Uncharacterized protein n=1 Tax=Kipferlia bialata TaxID=797122 RepID=A0A9K3CLV4_9EUKA|nr:hypothetical protein KIPB_000169 [Kipferlia bialata]|eukprot:g169.t1